MSNKKASAAKWLANEKRKLIGFTVMWRDSNPLGEADRRFISHDCVTHANSIKKLHCLKMWKHQSRFVLTTEFTWLIFAEVVFKTPNKMHSTHGLDEGEFRLTAPFQAPGDSRMNDAILEHIESAIERNNRLPEGHKNKGTYLYVNFQATIEGV